MLAIQRIWEELCELKLRTRNWHKISPQGLRNSESDFAGFTLWSCLVFSVIIVKLLWGQPLLWGDFAHSFGRWSYSQISYIQMWAHKMFCNQLNSSVNYVEKSRVVQVKDSSVLVQTWRHSDISHLTVAIIISLKTQVAKTWLVHYCAYSFKPIFPLTFC
jgi:hypothetical protein